MSILPDVCKSYDVTEASNNMNKAAQINFDTEDLETEKDKSLSLEVLSEES